ncbi:MAG TPA: hypothetical protein VF297_20640 [Pyrinomonadaceae bacterium]
MELTRGLNLRPQPGTPKVGWTGLRAMEALGLGGGVAALFLGLVLCAVGWAEGSREGAHILFVGGTALLLFAAPLLLLGAHCLDVEESRARRARNAPNTSGAGGEEL